jgi:integrase
MPSPTKFYLYKRKNGIYYVGYFHEGRLRWKSTRTAVKSQALKALTNIQSLLAPKLVATPLSQFVNDFLGYAQSTYAARTVLIYRQTLRHFGDVVGNPSITSLTLRHFDAYKTKRLGRIQAVSVNIELRALKATMSTAMRWKLLDANPFASGQMARVPEKSPVFFSHSDLESLLCVVDQSWLKEMIVFAVGTGMRQGEICNLRWQDVDLEYQLIHIEGHPNFHTKQGRRRTLPMSDVVRDMLTAKPRSELIEYVFTRKGHRIAESYLTHQFKKFLRKAGLSEELHWHSLRHTHASWLVQDGVPLYEV